MNLYSKIENELYRISSKEDKIILEKYFKNQIQFIGVKGPGIKNVFKDNKKNIVLLSNTEQNQLGFEFLQSKLFEMKQIGVCLFENKYKTLDEEFLYKIEKILKTDIKDWGNCDTLSSRVMGNMIRNKGEYANIIVKWSKKENTRLQRSSCVSFVKNAKLGTFNKEIIQICNNVIKNPERFAQLGAGWLLRELSLVEKKQVIKFIKDNYSLFSREGLRYAIEKMDNEEKRILLDFKSNFRPSSKT